MFKKKEATRVIPRWEVCLISKDYSTVRLMKSYFDSKQFKVYDFDNCFQAWKELRDQNPMVILLDKSLPDGNRTGFLRRLESDKKLKKVPVKIFAKEEYENKKAIRYKKQGQVYREDIVDFFKF